MFGSRSLLLILALTGLGLQGQLWFADDGYRKSMIVNGFCKEVLRELPMEFAVEAQKLLGVSLEGSVG